MALQNLFGNLALDATSTLIKTAVDLVKTAVDQVKTAVDQTKAVLTNGTQISALPAGQVTTLTPYVPQTNALTDAQLRATAVPVSFPAGAGLTDTQLRATPVPVTFPAGAGLTDTQLRATPVPVSTGLAPLTDTQLRATPVPVSGTVEVVNDVGNPLPVSGTVEVVNDVGNPLPVNGLVGVRGVDGVTLATLANPMPIGAPQELDAGNTTTITNTAATFTGAWKRTRSLGLVEQQTALASNVAGGLGATVTFQYSEDGVNPTVNEVRPIGSFASVRNLQLENFGEWYRIIVTPSRALTAAEFIYVTTQHNRLPGGQFVRLADQSTERAFAAMARTFAYLKGFDPTTGLDANVAVNASGTVATEEILSFPTLSLAKKGYALSTMVNIPTAVETDMLLFSNTAAAGGKLIRLYEQLASMPDSSTTIRCIIRIYKNPTVTLNGTALGIGGLRNGQAASVATAFTSPTISARGTLVQIYGTLNSPTQRKLELARYVEPGDSFLVTAQPSGVTTNVSFTQAWAEVSQ